MNATPVIDSTGQWIWNGYRWVPRVSPEPVYWYSAPVAPMVAKTSIPFRHGRHIVATILTGGLWLPFYAMLWFGHQVRRPKQVTRWN